MLSAGISVQAPKDGDPRGLRSRCRYMLDTPCISYSARLPGFHKIKQISPEAWIINDSGESGLFLATGAGLLGASIPIPMPASPMVSANGVSDFPLSSPHYFIIMNRDSCVLNRRSVRTSPVRFWLLRNETRRPPQAIPDAMIRRGQIVRDTVGHCLMCARGIARMSSTSQRDRPRPGAGKIRYGRTESRQRPTLAVGCPK